MKSIESKSGDKLYAPGPLMLWSGVQLVKEVSYGLSWGNNTKNILTHFLNAWTALQLLLFLRRHNGFSTFICSLKNLIPQNHSTT